jgi:hypothetical protein
MKKIGLVTLIIFALCFAAIIVNSIVVSAAPSCTPWTLQTDGSYWRTCVDDQGKQYCEQSKDGKVSRVSCK